MSDETLEAIRGIDLLSRRYRVNRRALLVGRDDLAPEMAIVERLAESGIVCDCIRVPGWLGMMADHQFTIVPDQALATIADWLAAQTGHATPATPAVESIARSTNAFAHETLGGAKVQIEEEIARFGAADHLVGVLSRPTGATDKPVILLTNAGAIHRVGPNRLYVTLARELAAMGIPSLRFDLETLGDSVRRDAGRENYPYPDTAIDDVRSAIAWLRTRGHRRFVILGLCSGAHTAFHGGLQIEDAQIDECVLVNPWEFYWVEGMSLDTNRHFIEMAAYKKKMKDPGRWMKLLKGQVDFRHAWEIGTSHAASIVRNKMKAIAELLGLAQESRLTRDLKKLLQRSHLAIFVSEGDPGRDLLMHGAKRTALRAMKAGRLELQMIPNADHTFSQWRSRRDVLGRLLDHFARRYDARVPAISGSESPAAARRAA
jgi:hypothetical protein